MFCEMCWFTGDLETDQSAHGSYWQGDRTRIRIPHLPHFRHRSLSASGEESFLRPEMDLRLSYLRSNSSNAGMGCPWAHEYAKVMTVLRNKTLLMLILESWSQGSLSLDPVDRSFTTVFVIFYLFVSHFDENIFSCHIINSTRTRIMSVLLTVLSLAPNTEGHPLSVNEVRRWVAMDRTGFSEGGDGVTRFEWRG